MPPIVGGEAIIEFVVKQSNCSRVCCVTVWVIRRLQAQSHIDNGSVDSEIDNAGWMRGIGVPPRPVVRNNTSPAIQTSTTPAAVRVFWNSLERATSSNLTWFLEVFPFWAVRCIAFSCVKLGTSVHCSIALSSPLFLRNVVPTLEKIVLDQWYCSK